MLLRPLMQPITIQMPRMLNQQSTTHLAVSNTQLVCFTNRFRLRLTHRDNPFLPSSADHAKQSASSHTKCSPRLCKSLIHCLGGGWAALRRTTSHTPLAVRNPLSDSLYAGIIASLTCWNE